MKYYVLLVAIFLVAGCTGIPGFGGDVVKVNQQTTEQGDRDIIVIKDIKSLPTTPVLPDQLVQLTFIVENVDTTKTVNLKNIFLFDAPLFKSIQGTPCNQNNACQPLNSDGSPFQPSKLLPKEQKLLRFDLKSPTANEIGSLKTKVKLQFKASYQSDTNLVFQVPLVSLDEIKSKQLAGQTLNLQVSKVYGPGPIEPDVELFGSPYILSGQPATLIFSVINKGKGQIATEDNNQIKIGYFTATLDPLLTPKDIPDSNIQCSGTCHNIKELDFYKDKTLPLRVETISQQLTNAPFKTLKIDATVIYNYEIRDALEIETAPYGSV